jgi:hypothetical protein
MPVKRSPNHDITSFDMFRVYPVPKIPQIPRTKDGPFPKKKKFQPRYQKKEKTRKSKEVKQTHLPYKKPHKNTGVKEMKSVESSITTSSNRGAKEKT